MPKTTCRENGSSRCSRLKECCRKVDVEVVANSRNKINRTWSIDFSRSLYKLQNLAPRFAPIKQPGLLLSCLLLPPVLLLLRAALGGPAAGGVLLEHELPVAERLPVAGQPGPELGALPPAAEVAPDVGRVVVLLAPVAVVLAVAVREPEALVAEGLPLDGRGLDVLGVDVEGVPASDCCWIAITEVS